MAVLDAADPIVVLQQQLQGMLIGYDGATVIAALALVLSASIQFVQQRSGEETPLHVRALQEDLLDLTAAIIQARSDQRES